MAQDFETQLPMVSINGRHLIAVVGEDPAALQERAWGELLRQAAVREGVLADVAGDGAPELQVAQQQAIEDWLEQAVPTPSVTPEACLRHYEANLTHFRHGQRAHVRHILFAVTPRVPVDALATRAEALLLELTARDVSPARFAEAAQVYSNCPSGAADGGDLGWLTASDCAPELAQYLFFQRDEGLALGVQPRLVHTRFGLHIVDVVAYDPGELAAFDAVKGRVETMLALRARATALRQFMLVLAGEAQLEGIELERAESPLVQ